MNQIIQVSNVNDENGNPAGGTVSAVGVTISWQNGPMVGNEKDAIPVPPYNGNKERGQNGAFVEGVIEAARQRLGFYQASKFACPENAEALEHLEAALKVLNDRTNRRVVAGTEGTHSGN